VENRVCLSRGVQVVGAAWRAAMRIMAGVGDLVQRIGDGRTGRVLGGWTIGRSGDAMYGLHHALGDKEHMFLSVGRRSSALIFNCDFVFPNWFEFMQIEARMILESPDQKT
jgi:hypothetical protein